MSKFIVGILIVLLVITTNGAVYAQPKDSIKLYELAYLQQMQMLKGKVPINFKKAVFLTENAFHNGKLDYQQFNSEIEATANSLKRLIKQRGLEKYKTAGNWAVFTYMTDSLPINNFKPCTYDFIDFMGDKDWTKMFVTKLMKTKGGNCNSLPKYYKILCDEIGAKSFLALAPSHLYIKHINEEGQWTNVELTNGGFPRDQWIIKEMAISVEAIKNEVYMKPLTDKENIALTMYDLASAYQYQFGFDEFVLKVVNAALVYFPKCIPLLMTKANCHRDLGLAEKVKLYPNKQFLKANLRAYEDSISKVDSLGFKEMPEHQYEEWVKMIEKEKLKRGVVTN